MIRKSSIFSIVLSLLTVSLSAQVAQEPAYTPQPASLVAERMYEQAKPVSFAYESFSLHADSPFFWDFFFPNIVYIRNLL